MLINVKNLDFSYGNTKILKKISFEVGTGELIAVLGPNGVGKSTLFKCLLGFLNLKNGEIEYSGTNIKQITRKNLAREIAYIPQYYHPAFEHTVLETVLMGLTGSLSVFEQPTDKDIKKALKALEDLNIKKLAYRNITKISGGERQLVLLARALVQNASVIIMDEPTASLDYGNSFLVMETMVRLCKEGKTIIFSTHEPNQVFQYATRVMAMKDGEIIADGLPNEIINEDILNRLYNIDISLNNINVGDKEYKICIPKSR